MMMGVRLGMLRPEQREAATGLVARGLLSITDGDLLLPTERAYEVAAGEHGWGRGRDYDGDECFVGPRGGANQFSYVETFKELCHVQGIKIFSEGATLNG